MARTRPQYKQSKEHPINGHSLLMKGVLCEKDKQPIQYGNHIFGGSAYAAIVCLQSVDPSCRLLARLDNITKYPAPFQLIQSYGRCFHVAKNIGVFGLSNAIYNIECSR